MKNLLIFAALAVSSVSMAQSTLGALTFNDSQFGNSVIESDGGTHSSSNWISTVDANPGNPAILTGANFDTGVANLDPGLRYTIGYNTPILNGVGDDLAVVVARFDTGDVDISFSTDGVNFGTEYQLAAGSFVDSGEDRGYYYGSNNSVNPASLYTLALDLDNYGIAALDSVVAVKLGTDNNGGDIVRVAGLNPVPEPATMTLLGLGALAAFNKRKKRA